MQYIGNIKLPLQGTVKATGTDIEILDYLWDMHIQDMAAFLEKVHQFDQPALMVLRQAQMKFVGLFIYRPPDIWLDFDYQKYQLYLSPSFALLIYYWVDKRMHTQDIFEAEVIGRIIQYLEHHVKSLTVSHT